MMSKEKMRNQHNHTLMESKQQKLYAQAVPLEKKKQRETDLRKHGRGIICPESAWINDSPLLMSIKVVHYHDDH